MKLSTSVQPPTISFNFSLETGLIVFLGSVTTFFERGFCFFMVPFGLVPDCGRVYAQTPVMSCNRVFRFTHQRQLLLPIGLLG